MPSIRIFQPGGVHQSRAWRQRLILSLCAILLASCKIVIVVPVGGKVVSENGEECLAGKICVIEVTDTSYDDRFTAKADDDYVFLGWKKQAGALCGGGWHSCRLVTTAFAGHADLENVLASDNEYFLEPQFVRRTRYRPALWARMLDEIDERRFVGNGFLYDVVPNPGGCDPGVLSSDAKLRFWRALDMIRALHNLPPVDYDSFFDMQMQETSLVQETNVGLNHNPEPGDNCYTAEAAAGSASANLSGGSRPEDPASGALGWTNDNNNLAALMAAGHRRWVLFPELGFTSFGTVVGSAAMKVFNFNKVPRVAPSADLEFVAFPYLDYPYVLVEKGSNPTPWSLSIVPAQGVSSEFDHFSSASVSVRDAQTGAALPVHSQYYDTQRFGLGNFFSWMVDNWEYDRDYTVTVAGIRMPGGDVQTLEYPVRLDRFNLFNVNKPREQGDVREGDAISGTFKNPSDKDSYGMQLAGSKAFSLRSGQFSGGFFVLIYDSEKRLVKTADRDFSMNFTSGGYTVMTSPCDTDGLCYVGVDSYSVMIE